MEDKGLTEVIEVLGVFIPQAVGTLIDLVTLPFRLFFALLA